MIFLEEAPYNGFVLWLAEHYNVNIRITTGRPDHQEAYPQGVACLSTLWVRQDIIPYLLFEVRLNSRVSFSGAVIDFKARKKDFVVV